MIFNIQRFSLHDGDGVRTVVFFKGCPLRCAWCSNPESQSFQPEAMLDKAKCIGCKDCLNRVGGVGIGWDNGPVLDRTALDAAALANVCPTEALSIAGKSVSVPEILREAARDAVFYRSKGGITLSGGEPFAQPDLALNALRAVKEYGLSTGVETCLAVPWRNIEPSLPYLDAIYADVKHIDGEKYRNATGGDIGLALDNLARAANSAVPVSARIPVIPRFNNAPEELEGIIRHVAGLGIRVAHLMAYHTLGKGKYALLGRGYRLDAPSIPPESLQPVADALAGKYKIEIRVGG